MQSDINYLNKHGVHGKYFIKLFDQNTLQLNKFFLTPATSPLIPCPQTYYILNNSFGYQYLLKDYPIQFYSNVVVNVSFNRNCIKYQQIKIFKHPQRINFNGSQIKYSYPQNQISVGTEYKKFQKAVKMMNKNMKKQIKTLASQIGLLSNESVGNKNQQNYQSKRLMEEVVLTNQINYEKIDKTMKEKLNEMSQKQYGKVKQVVKFYQRKQKEEQFKKNMLCFFVVLASIVFVVSGVIYIFQKLEKLRKNKSRQCNHSPNEQLEQKVVIKSSTS